MNFDYFYNRQSEMYYFIRLPILMEYKIFEIIYIEAKVLYCLIEWIFHMKMDRIQKIWGCLQSGLLDLLRVFLRKTTFMKKYFHSKSK